MIRFFCAGLPKSMKVSGVARFQKAGKIHMVPKRGNTEWATMVGEVGRRVKPEVPLKGPIIFTAVFWIPRPKSKKKAVWPLTRPDIDNLFHKLTDQFNGVFWEDDSQVVEVSLGKRYTHAAQGPGVEVTVAEIQAAQVTLALEEARS